MVSLTENLTESPLFKSERADVIVSADQAKTTGELTDPRKNEKLQDMMIPDRTLDTAKINQENDMEQPISEFNKENAQLGGEAAIC